ncbi:NADH-quinone oxidoreductase subunit L [Paenibacillus phyllosphaerae]|uniref:NADH-quinone oxidoreductase subunit L n=1 Tax=Paenibacillus phyllosphaerae TaxID=274593 RepID=A0A7W5AYM6_9BACL|nr:NADH-quinone oxidoreductase subunit L [Paenibacillus phyllosphaerae]MBB3110541.1 NADH-quinone oxidoreductase subunit L [Paenibacillus phyllosphaerae]
MNTIFTQYAWLVPLFPLAAFVLLTAFGRGFRGPGIVIGTLGSLASFLLALLILFERIGAEAEDYRDGFTWLDVGQMQVTIGYEVTNLSTLMLVIVTLVGFLVHVYSMGYMKNDERITVFYSYLSLFTFSMLGLVLADNLLALYIFWELVGVCSFLLIGFWFTRPEARAAAKKAFIVTRIGDAGLFLGIVLLYWQMPNHALDFASIQNVFEGQPGAIAAGMTTLIALLIFLGAVGKSGQFPLHVWLPDAMEGPTPVSALIHAATMVAAGVYLVARTFDIFEASQAAMDTVAYIGAFTAIFAATIATVQNDIKRILAYSTVSQLGYMMLGLGLGSLTGGIFHLMTHAFFKAMLFLAAGNVIHALHVQNVQEMGGLRSRMRVTAVVFGVGVLAISGIPPLSGFWSKDAILHTALQENTALFVVGLAAAFLTAFYMARLFFLVFWGKPRSEAAVNAQEQPWVMTVPLIILAIPAVLAGGIETPWNNNLGKWLSGGEGAFHTGGGLVMVVSAAVGALGIYVSWLVFAKGTIAKDTVSARLPWLIRLLEKSFYLDGLYKIVVVRGLQLLGLLLMAIDKIVIAGAVRLVGSTAVLLGRGGTRLQNGQVQTYGVITLLGLVLLLIVIVGRRLWS